MAKIAEKALDLDSKSVEFTFADGTVLAVSLGELSADIQLHLALHGIGQKVGDAYSGAKGDVAVAKASAQAVIDQLKSGEWRAARGEGEAKPRVGELAEAIARIKGVAVEEVAKSLAGASDEQRKALRANDRVKAIIQVIRAEKAQKKLENMDDDDALEAFGN